MEKSWNFVSLKKWEPCPVNFEIKTAHMFDSFWEGYQVHDNKYSEYFCHIEIPKCLLHIIKITITIWFYTGCMFHDTWHQHNKH